MILAVLLDGDGRPVCTEMWPGNTADVGSLVPVVDRLRKRFSIQRVCVVADRGMISAETIAELEARGLCYILGMHKRSDKLVRDLVLADPALPFHPTHDRQAGQGDRLRSQGGRAGRAALHRLSQPRRDEEGRRRQSRDPGRARASASRKGDKTLVGNKGYRRFSRRPTTTTLSSIAPRRRRTPSSTRMFVLRTNADLSPLETMLCYKHLWMVERAF